MKQKLPPRGNGSFAAFFRRELGSLTKAKIVETTAKETLLDVAFFQTRCRLVFVSLRIA